MVDGARVAHRRVDERFEPPTEFVVPGQTRVAAQLDVARTVVRRAERASLHAVVDGSHVLPYLNRLSDLVLDPRPLAGARLADGSQRRPRRGLRAFAAQSLPVRCARRNAWAERNVWAGESSAGAGCRSARASMRKPLLARWSTTTSGSCW